MYHTISVAEMNYELSNDDVIKIAKEIYEGMKSDNGFDKFSVHTEYFPPIMDQYAGNVYRKGETARVVLGVSVIPVAEVKMIEGKPFPIVHSELIGVDSQHVGDDADTVLLEYKERGQALAEMIRQAIPDVRVEETYDKSY